MKPNLLPEPERWSERDGRNVRRGRDRRVVQAHPERDRAVEPGVRALGAAGDGAAAARRRAGALWAIAIVAAIAGGRRRRGAASPGMRRSRTRGARAGADTRDPSAPRGDPPAMAAPGRSRPRRTSCCPIPSRRWYPRPGEPARTRAVAQPEPRQAAVARPAPLEDRARRARRRRTARDPRRSRRRPPRPRARTRRGWWRARSATFATKATRRRRWRRWTSASGGSAPARWRRGGAGARRGAAAARADGGRAAVPGRDPRRARRPDARGARRRAPSCSRGRSAAARRAPDFDALLAPGAPAATRERALYARASCRLQGARPAGAVPDLESYLAEFPTDASRAGARRAGKVAPPVTFSARARHERDMTGKLATWDGAGARGARLRHANAHRRGGRAPGRREPRLGRYARRRTAPDLGGANSGGMCTPVVHPTISRSPSRPPSPASGPDSPGRHLGLNADAIKLTLDQAADGTNQIHVVYGSAAPPPPATVATEPYPPGWDHDAWSALKRLFEGFSYLGHT